MALPALPPPPFGQAWSPQIHHSVSILQDVHQSISNALGAANLNAHRIQHYIDRITDPVLPLLTNMSDAISLADRKLLDPWLQSCVKKFGALFSELLSIRSEAEGEYVF